MFHTNWRSSRSGPRWSLRSLPMILRPFSDWVYDSLNCFLSLLTSFVVLGLNSDACSLYEVQTVSYNRYFCSMSTIYLCMYSLNFNELIALLWIFICDEHVCDEKRLGWIRWWPAQQGGRCWSLTLVQKCKLLWHFSLLFTNLKCESKYSKDYSSFCWAPDSVDVCGVGHCEPARLPGDWDTGVLLQYCPNAEFSIDIWSATILTRITTDK